MLELPKHRKHVADWYETIRKHAVTGEKTTFTHATIYVEERAESELGFGVSDTLERQIVAKVLEVGIACDPNSRLVEICARGGKKVRDKFSEVFSKNFAPNSKPPLEVPRRDVLLNILKRQPDFNILPSDGIERVEISSLDFGDSSSGIARFEKRGEGESIYGFLDRRFGAASPLRAGGWTILAATIRIILEGQEGKRRRTLTVTLRLPNTTTSPNTTESDQAIHFRSAGTLGPSCAACRGLRRFGGGICNRLSCFAKSPHNVERSRRFNTLKSRFSLRFWHMGFLKRLVLSSRLLA